MQNHGTSSLVLKMNKKMQLVEVLAVTCYVSSCQDCSCVFSPTRSVVRLAASLLTKLVDSLAPSITSVLVHGKQVSGHTDSRA